MPSIAKQLRASIDALVEAQECPFLDFNEVSIKRINKEQSMHNMDESKIILRRHAHNPATADGYLSIEVHGAADKCNWVSIQLKMKDQHSFNVLYTPTEWTFRNVDVLLGHRPPVGDVYKLSDDTKKKKEIATELLNELSTAILNVGERILKRFSSVDLL